MNQQPDKLFREKLQNYQKPASLEAWSKLEAKLDRKKTRPMWIKIAASLLLALSVSALIFNNRISTTHVAEVDKPILHREAQQKIAPIKEAPVETDSNKDIKDVTLSKRKSTKQHTNSVPKKVYPKQQPANDIAITENETVTELQNEVTPIVEAPTANVDQPQATIVLVYSVNEVNEKYLVKNDTSQATTENKKPSTLQKLWSKAKDLKHNQDPFGELRQKKNEILALDFKKEEQRNQNR